MKDDVLTDNSEMPITEEETHSLSQNDKAVVAALREERLRELARLSPMDYDNQREATAKNLGIRVGTLDAEVEKRRPRDESNTADDGRGGAIVLDEPEPWEYPVDGDVLLDAVRDVFLRYLILPAGAAVALALWVIHTYLLDVADASPILAISSPEKRCGKTALLEILQALTMKPLPASNITTAALFRTIEAYRPTLLIDEADSFLKDNEELRGVLNSGHRKATAIIIRTTGDDHEPKTFSTWCPKAIAAIGKLPGTLEDRAIIIMMRRKAKDEAVNRIRYGALTRETKELRRKAARWAQDKLETLKHSDPSVPAELNDRAADCWRPLLAIADLLAGTWAATAREAALLLSGSGDDSSTGTQLLTDIRMIFEQQQTDRLTSETIVKELAELEDRPWPEWKGGKPISKAQLARQLGRFDIKPKKIRVGSTTAQGYDIEQFTDAFGRYSAFQSGTPEQSTTGAGFSDFAKRNTPDNVPDEKSNNTSEINDVPDVPFRKPVLVDEEEI